MTSRKKKKMNKSSKRKKTTLIAISITETAILRENPMPAAPRIRKIHKQKAIIARKRNEKMEKEVNLKAEKLTPG